LVFSLRLDGGSQSLKNFGQIILGSDPKEKAQRTWEPVAPMPREKLKWKPHESESTDAEHGGGTTRSSDEVP